MQAEMMKYQKDVLRSQAMKNDQETMNMSLQATAEAIKLNFLEAEKKYGVSRAKSESETAETTARYSHVEKFLSTQQQTWDIIEKSREDLQSRALFPYQEQTARYNVEQQRTSIRRSLTEIANIQAQTRNTDVGTEIKTIEKDLANLNVELAEKEKILKDYQISLGLGYSPSHFLPMAWPT
jgi:hypothetical protein